MSETRTKIKIEADARGLKQAKKDVEGIVSPKGAKVGAKAFDDIGKSLKDALGSIKDFRRELRLSIVDARRLGSEVKKTRQAGGASQRPSGGKASGSFIGGVAQGSGLIQYLPTGPGMYRRMAGAAVGGWGRRLGHGALAPFKSPGVAGIGQMLGALPFGGLAQGAFSAASGMYQQYMGFERSKLNQLYWAGGADVFDRRIFHGRAINPKWEKATARKKAFDAYEKSLVDETGKWSSQVSLAEKVLRQQSGKHGVMSPALRKRIMTDANPVAALYHRTFKEIRRDEKMGRVNTHGNIFKFMLANAKANLKEAKDDLKEYGYDNKPDVSGDVSGAKKWRRFSRATGGLGRGRMFSPWVGVGLGLDPSQALGMVGQFMGARGGVASIGAEKQARAALAAHVGYGVSMVTSGALARGRMSGGGGTGYGAGLAGILQAAVEQGLKGSQVPEYLESIATMTKEAERQGQKFNITEFTRSTAMLSAMGVGKLQRGAIATGLSRAAMKSSRSGIGGPGDLMLHMAAGYRPGGGEMSYIRASNRLAGGMSNHIMGNLLGRIVSSTSSFRGKTDEETVTMRAFRVRRALSSHYGVGLSPATARALVEGGIGSKDRQAFYERFSAAHGLAGVGQSDAARRALGVGAHALTIRGAGGSIAGASLQASRISAGGKLASTFVRLERVGITSARTIGNFSKSIARVTGLVDEFSKRLERGTKGGLAGMTWHGFVDAVTGGH